MSDTEITYTFSIQDITSTTAGQATANEDYIFISRGTTSTINDITPNDQSFGVQIIIIDDGVPERNETFQLALSRARGKPQFKLGTYSSATITILDDDSELIMRGIGKEGGSWIKKEDRGRRKERRKEDEEKRRGRKRKWERKKVMKK